MTIQTDSDQRLLHTAQASVGLRPYYVYVPSTVGPRMVLDPEIPVIVCSQDAIRVGERVMAATYGPRTVSFSQQGPGWTCSGYLYADPDGLELRGTIAIGSAPSSGGARAIFASALPPSTYETLVTTGREPVGTDPTTLPPDAWQAGSELELGYVIDPSTSFPATYVTIDGQDVSDYVSLGVDEHDDLVLSLDATAQSSVLCAVDTGLPLAQSITFSTFDDTFSGAISATCADPSGSGVYLITGSAQDQRLTVAGEPAVASEHATPDTTAAGAPTPGDLLAQVPDQTVSDEANALLVENMKWAIGQSATERHWVTDFFGTQPPVLPDSRTTLIAQDLDWYQQQLSIAYLAQGLDGVAGSTSVHLDDDQRARLKAFLQHGMGQSAPYARQMSGLFQSAYLSVKPGLAPYLADGETWATNLLADIGSGTPLTNMTNQIGVTKDASAAGNLAALLHALEPAGTSARTYQRRLVGNALMRISLQTTVQDVDWTGQWLPAALKSFATQYSPPESASPTAAAETDPDPAQQRAEIAAAVQEAADAFGGFSALADEMAKFYVLYKGESLPAQAGDAAAAFARAYPNAAQAASVMFAIAWIGGLFSVIAAFVNWDEQSGTEQGQTIDELVSLVGDAADKILGLLKPDPTLPDIMEMVDFAAGEDTVEGFVTISQNLVPDDADVLDVGITETTSLFDTETGTIAAEGTIWAKVLGVAEKVLGWLGVAVAAVSSVLSTIDFINDIEKGDVDKAVLDGILAAANAGLAVSLVLGLVLESTIAMMAASVLAIVGLLISLIELFLPQPKEPTPADTFMQQTAIPFVNSLPAPSAPA